jgi:RHS repeat-associated protein
MASVSRAKLTTVIPAIAAIAIWNPVHAQQFCATNPRLYQYETCFASQGEAEEYLRRDVPGFDRRRFLQPDDAAPPFSFNTGTNSFTSVLINYKTRPAYPEDHIVTWFNAFTGVNSGVTLYEPYPEGRIAELPDDDAYGRATEAQVFADILARDNKPGPGTLTGVFRSSPPGTGLLRPDPTGLGRLQLHYDYGYSPRRTFNSGSRPWTVDKFARWWCPRDLDKVMSGKCNNEEWGNLRIKEMPQHSCPATAMPCVPGTGAKELHEVDFTWGGWQFTRYYTSLGGFPYEATLGNQWSHSFSNEIIPLRAGDSTARRFALDEKRNFEVFTDVDATWLRSQNVTGRRLKRTGDATLPFRLYLADRVQTFNASGKLAAIERPEALADSVDLTYCDSTNYASGACTATGQLWKVTDRRGRSIEFIYSPDMYSGPVQTSVYLPRHLVEVRTVDGWLVRYDYDDKGRLEWVTRSDGTQRRYHYQEAAHVCVNSAGAPLAPCPTAGMVNHLTGITDEHGSRLSDYTYDNLGRVTSSVWAGGAFPEKLTYPTSTTRQLTHPSGRVESLTFGSYQRFKKPTQVSDAAGTRITAYDTLGRKVSVTDKRGIVTKTEYAGERVSATIEAFGTPEQRRTEFDWNQADDTLTERRVNNAAGTLVARQTYAYNARRQPTITSVIDPATGVARTTTRTYCEAADVFAGSLCPITGLLKSVDGPRTDVADTTVYQYYPSTDLSGCATSGPCHHQGDTWKVINAAGHVQELLRYDEGGHLLASKDANGVVTELAWNARGWLTERTIKGPTPALDATTAYSYEPTGELSGILGPEGASTSFEYDDAHRLVAIEDALGNRVEYVPNAAGERVAEVTRDAAGIVRRSVSREYDALGRLDIARDAYAKATDFGYDGNGNQVSIKDPLNVETVQEFDSLDRLKRTLQDASGLAIDTRFAYDTLDRLAKVTDPKALETTYAYNGFGDLTQLVSHDTGTSSYTYDAAGNRKTQTDARGITATYGYDVLNRLTGIVYPLPGEDVTLSYDQPNAVTGCVASAPLGRITNMTDASGSTTYCYDPRGAVISKAQTVGTTSWSLGYAYDLAGQLIGMTYPDTGPTVAYERGVDGRIDAVTIDGEPFITGVSRTAFGEIAQITYADGTSSQRTYDQNGAVATILSSALDLAYTRNAVGNVIGLGNDRTYQYDSAQRLTHVRDGAGNVLEAFTYDATGNRLSKTRAGITQPYQYPVTSHRLASVGGQARSYDAAGNTVAAEGSQFTYNAANRMGSVSGTGNATFAYNGRGERVRKNDEVFLFDEAGHQLVSTHPVVVAMVCKPVGGGADDVKDSENSTLEKAASLGDKPAACGVGWAMKPVYERKPGWVVWMDELPIAFKPATGLMLNEGLLRIETDALGTPRTLHRPWTGETVWRWELEGSVFGEDPATEDVDGDGINVELALRYPGQYFDGESRLHYNYFRDYEPGAGRYIESDPTGLDGGVSTYGYVGGSPLKWSDAFGLEYGAPFGAVDRMTQPLPPGDGCEECKCWLSCLTNDPLLPELLAGFGFPFVNHKTPREMRPGASSWTSVDRRLPRWSGANPNAGATVTRGVIRRVKCVGRYGTVAAAVGAFTAGYTVGAAGRCWVECN